MSAGVSVDMPVCVPVHMEDGSSGGGERLSNTENTGLSVLYISEEASVAYLYIRPRRCRQMALALSSPGTGVESLLTGYMFLRNRNKALSGRSRRSVAAHVCGVAGYYCSEWTQLRATFASNVKRTPLESPG